MKLAALLLWTSARASVAERCAPGEVCAEDEATSMKTSLLQISKANGGEQAEQLAQLEIRKVELLAQLGEIEEKVWQSNGEVGTWEWGSKNCKSYGCNYKRGRNCQCNRECGHYKSCCDDYRPKCAPPTEAPTPEPTTPEPTPPTPAPTPPTPPPPPGICDAELPTQPATCQKAASWAKSDGIYGHPEWYEGLDNTSSCDDFAMKMAREHSEGCRLPPTPAPPTPPPPPPTPAPKAHELPYGHPTPGKKYPEYPGFTLWLAEEFEEPLDLDTDPIWTWSDGGLREGSVRFVKEQIKFEGGIMKIEARKNEGGPKTQSCSKASVEKIGYKPLISGELRSRHNIFRYGRYEVRMKAPNIRTNDSNANGNFISTMFFYRDANAHHWREIDFEITADGPNTVMTNLLYADGTKNWRADLQDDRRPPLGHINTRSDFHEYAFEWTPKGVIWMIDGKEVRRGTRLKTPELSGKVMMNLWIFTGGGFGGRNIRNNQYPMTGEYDWFRFYRWDGETQYPCKKFETSCLAKDDFYLSGNNPCDGIAVEGVLEGHRPCAPYTPSDCPTK